MPCKADAIPDRGDPLLTPPPFSDEEVAASHADLTLISPALGQGSFKVAYRVEAPDGPRVLKIIYSHPFNDDPDEFDMNSLPERISRELSGMSAVESPNVVTLLSEPVLRRIGKASYICFEEPHYSGGTLEDELRSGPLERSRVRELALTLLTASKAMWDSNKIVHRDIKPGNIAYDASRNAVLLDLGLALFTELSAITDSGLPSPATPRYAAPEQFELRRNAQIDFRTDQYLIGLTVVEAATGKHPFWYQGISTAEYFDRMENFKPSDLDDLNVDEDLKDVLGRLLAPQMYARFRNPDLPIDRLTAAK